MRIPLTFSVALALSAVATLHAASGTWTFAGNGSWDTSSNWSGSTIADGVNATATFSYGLPNTTSSVISVDTARNIGNLTFTGTAGAGTHNITLNGPQALTLSTGTATAPAISSSMASRTITINTILAGTEGVSFSNTGNILLLGGANTYTGTTTVTAGILTIGNNQALGSTTGGTVVNNGTQITLNTGITVTGESLTLNGSGAGGSTTGALQTGGTSEWAGNISLGNGSVRLGTSISTAQLKVSGVVSGSQTLAIGGSGTVVLAGVNTYTGNTQVVRGTLKLDGGNNRLPTGTALDIWGAANADNAVFELNGFNQTVASLTRNTVVSGATSTLTNSSGTASLFTVNGTASTTYSGNITGNLSLVKAGTGTLTLTGTNSFTGGITIQGGGLSINSAFINDTADVSLLTGSVFNLNFSSTDTIGGLYIDGASQSIGTYGSIGSTATFQSAYFTGSGILNVTTTAAIPEPSAFAALVGVMALGLGLARRRRS